MKNKPSWKFWGVCVVAYAALDLFLTGLLHGGLAWGQVKGAAESALFGATVTWLFALYKWHKADCGL